MKTKNFQRGEEDGVNPAAVAVVVYKNVGRCCFLSHHLPYIGGGRVLRVGPGREF